MIKVSIVVPIYNMERYLKKCLDSICIQSEESFEVLMIDDGSTDSSSEIAKEYLKDNRFHYIYQTNAGVSVARNNGINNSCGEWIAFIDSDDSITSDYIKHLLSEVETGVDIICCGCQYENGNNYEVDSFFEGMHIFTENIIDESSLKYPKKELYLELMDSQYNAKRHRETAIGVPWGKLYRTKFLKENQILFDVRLKRLQDNIFNMYAFEKANAVKYIDESLYIYNLDHIANYNRKFDKRAHEFLDLVCTLRHDFLESRQMLTDPEIYNTYCCEVARITDNMLKKYYLNLDNPLSIKQCVGEMKDKFSEKKYQDALNTNCISEMSGMRKMRLTLLKKHKYVLLILTDRIIQFVRKLI